MIRFYKKQVVHNVGELNFNSFFFIQEKVLKSEEFQLKTNKIIILQN